MRAIVSQHIAVTHCDRRRAAICRRRKRSDRERAKCIRKGLAHGCLGAANLDRRNAIHTVNREAARLRQRCIIGR